MSNLWLLTVFGSQGGEEVGTIEDEFGEDKLALDEQLLDRGLGKELGVGCTDVLPRTICCKKSTSNVSVLGRQRKGQGKKRGEGGAPETDRVGSGVARQDDPVALQVDTHRSA